MAILRESPWYQQILQEGEQLGEQRGEQRGLRLGIQQAHLDDLLEVLEIRFGTVPQEIQARLRIQDADQLRQLFREALTCSDLETFQQQIDNE